MPVPEAPERSLKDYWGILLRRRWVLLSFFVICTGTATLGTYLMTPLYRASTTLIVEGENTVLHAEESGSSGMNFDLFENYLETQMALIKSRSIAGAVANEFKLPESPRYQKREGLGKLLEKKFTDDIHLQRVPGTRMLAVSVDNPDPQKAADLANRLADVYAQENLSRRSLTFIRNQRMSALNAEFSHLQQQYDSLSKQFGPKYPAMIDLKKEIDVMAKRIAG
ncbi:MAG TPA: Wzz/FepE/Etk N-terminal domain-containing protein, partial [Candidatus Eisenbacteria bacterium]|nr:Wzz/FepE/Etk N-terminal domain-containing protein [Candidatus Eisenbacteria bacterium]